MYNIGLLIYKYHHGWLPRIFNLFERNADVHNYYTRQSNLLHTPLFTTEFGKRSFRYQAVTIWNTIYLSLSVDIKIGTFKKNLKVFLVKN